MHTTAKVYVLKKGLTAIGFFLLMGFTACSSSSDEATSYIQKQQYVCSSSGGSVSSSGRNNCDYTASISTTTAATVATTDTTSQAAIDGANASVQTQCEYAAQLKNVQCKYDRLVSDQSSCQTQAANFVKTLNTYATKTDNSSASTDSNGLLTSLLSATTSTSSGGTDCSTEFKNAYMTFMTARNGALANSREGCAILESYITQISQKYASQVSSSGLAALSSLSGSLSTSSCPANDVMRMIYSSFGSGTSSDVAKSRSNGTIDPAELGSPPPPGPSTSFVGYLPVKSSSSNYGVKSKVSAKKSKSVPNGLNQFIDSENGFRAIY